MAKFFFILVFLLNVLFSLGVYNEKRNDEIDDDDMIEDISVLNLSLEENESASTER